MMNQYEGWSLDELYNAQRKNGIWGDKGFDQQKGSEIEAALRKANTAPEIRIPKSESVALNQAADDFLDFDFIVRAKMSPKCEKGSIHYDPLYVKAIEKGCEELGAAKQRQLDAEAEKNRTTLLDRG
jgi:hypothetical protein